MKQLLILLLSLLLLSSCDNSGADFVNTFQTFYVVDRYGNDLLNPETANAINTKNIKIYYLVDGEKIEYSEYRHRLNPNTISYGFGIGKPDSIGNRNRYYIDVLLNDGARKDKAITYTYIQWSDKDTDTIQSKVSKGGSHLVTRMTAYNDSVWTHKEGEIYTIIK